MVEDRFERALVSYDRALMVRHSDAAKPLKLPVYQLTALGRQVLRLGSFQANDKYLRALGASIKSQEFEVEIGLCVPVSESEVTLFNLQPIDDAQPVNPPDAAR